MTRTRNRTETPAPETPITVRAKPDPAATALRLRAEIEQLQRYAAETKEALDDEETTTKSLQGRRKGLERRLQRVLQTSDGSAGPMDGEAYAAALAEVLGVEDAAQELLDDLDERLEPERADPPEHALSTSSRSTAAHASLPHVPLPEFDGDPRHYRRFIEQFRCLVLDRNDVPDTLKMAHLLSALTGTAKEAYGNFETRGENLQPLLDALQEHYGDPATLLVKEVETLLHIPQPRGNDTVGLRSLLIGFESGIAGDPQPP